MFECHQGQLLAVTMNIKAYGVWNDWRPSKFAGYLDEGDMVIALTHIKLATERLHSGIRVLSKHGAVFLRIDSDTSWLAA